MRLVLFLAATVLTLTLQTIRAQLPSDETAVRAVIAREIDGWAKFDPKQVASTYTEDVVWQNPFGVRLHGRAQVEGFLTNLMARPGYRAATDTNPAKILELRMTSATTAAVWSDESSKGQVNDVSGHPMEPRHSYYLEVLVKKDGVWKISDLLIMDVIHLK